MLQARFIVALIMISRFSRALGTLAQFIDGAEKADVVRQLYPRL